MVHSKNDNIEIMINNEVGKLEKKLLIHFFPDIKVGWKHELKVVILHLMLLIYCICIHHKIKFRRGGSYTYSPDSKKKIKKQQ